MSRLGDTLRERRTQLGVSLEAAERATRIRATLLKALEEGDWDRLPNPGYVRGYISSYARFLELDAPPLLAMYRSETGAGRYHRIDLPDEAVAPTGEQHMLPWRSAVAAVTVVALLAFSVWAVTRLWRGPEPTPPVPVPAAQATPTVEPGSQSTESPLASDTPQAKSQPKPPSKLAPFTLEISVASDGASWIEVEVDGKSAYAGTMTAGQTEKFEVTKSATVVIGRPSVTTVKRDGENVEIPESGGSSKLTLDAEPAQ